MAKRIIIEIETHNYAFVDDDEAEVARILRELVEAGVIRKRPLYDVNGNRVGEVRVTRSARSKW